MNRVNPARPPAPAAFRGLPLGGHRELFSHAMATAYTLKALLGECAAKRARVHTAVPKADKERVALEDAEEE